MRFLSRSVRQTRSIGARLARRLKAGDIICLAGPLGSGKTVLAGGIAAGLGIRERGVISPTFILIREYADGRLPLYHFDLYRLRSAREILGLGYEEYFYGDGVTVVEWPDRLKNLLPNEYLKVELSVQGPRSRRIVFSGAGERYRELTEQLSEDLRH